MNFFDLIKLKQFDSDEFRMVRHADTEICELQGLGALETFRKYPYHFETYQSFQARNRFQNSRYIAVFAPYYGTQGLFIGVWEIKNNTYPHSKAPARKRKIMECFNWDEGTYYELKPVEDFKDLSERVVIEWGRSTVAWVQKKDKPIIAILPPAHAREFESYDKTVLDHAELVKLVENAEYNATWYNALRSVNDIYCITDNRNGKLYVGSVYGENGIWGRWEQYKSSDHGGNKKLKELLKNNPKC